MLGSNLCDVHQLDIPVPPGFIITSEVCKEMMSSNADILQSQFVKDYERAVHDLEHKSGKSFGIAVTDCTSFAQVEKMPLLLSIRPGASVRMPGMMESVLNVGMNDEIVAAMVRVSANPHWVLDTYRRFLQSFGTVVCGVDKHKYLDILTEARNKCGVTHTSALSVSDLEAVITAFKLVVPVPKDPWVQLKLAFAAVHAAWHSPKAVKYRELHHIPSTEGVAITVQAMVFGNANLQSGTGSFCSVFQLTAHSLYYHAGVVFSRNPSTGGLLCGEYVPQSEGDDIGSGGRTPDGLWAGLGRENFELYNQVVRAAHVLEAHFKDVLEIEFVVENGVLFVLQCTPAQRTPQAAVHIAISLVNEKVLSEREALLRLQPAQMDYFHHEKINPLHGKRYKGDY